MNSSLSDVMLCVSAFGLLVTQNKIFEDFTLGRYDEHFAPFSDVVSTKCCIDDLEKIINRLTDTEHHRC